MPIDTVALAQRAAGFEMLATDCVTLTLVATHTMEGNIGTNGRDYIVVVSKPDTANRVGRLDHWDDGRRCCTEGRFQEFCHVRLSDCEDPAMVESVSKHV
jgi:hypothetical protein